MTMAIDRIAPEIGDFVPGFELPTADGKIFGTRGLMGKTLAVVFIPSFKDEAVVELNELARRLHEFESSGAALLCIVAGTLEPQIASRTEVPVMLDQGGELFRAYAASIDPAMRTAVILDPAMRIVSRYSGTDIAEMGNSLHTDMHKSFARDPARQLFMHAPVLVLSDVLPIDLCKRLIDLWETQGNVDSGSMIQRDGQTVPVYNYDHKIRRDHFMQAGPDEEAVKTYIGRRVVPQIRKAFNYNVSRREDFRIACYDASRGGYFRPHRDNTTEGTSHRRFAMSLILNDDYDGGFLRFPEFGQHLYRPEAGSAVIFSCSLLHEATDVTAGRRFVLLSFFYGEAEAKAREAYNAKTGGAYRA